MRTVRGSTPVGAPRLANELASELLDGLSAAGARWPSVRDAYHAEFRFTFLLPPLLTFSYELDPSVVGRIAEIGVPVLFRHADGSRGGFESWKLEAGLEVWTDDRDPDVVTERLGVVPTSTGRIGEPITPGKKSLCKRSVWRLGPTGEPPTDIDGVVERLLAHEPEKARWAEVCRDFDARVRFSFQVPSLNDPFELRADRVGGLASLGVPLGFYFYNRGA